MIYICACNRRNKMSFRRNGGESIRQSTRDGSRQKWSIPSAGKLTYVGLFSVDKRSAPRSLCLICKTRGEKREGETKKANVKGNLKENERRKKEDRDSTDEGTEQSRRETKEKQEKEGEKGKKRIERKESEEGQKYTLTSPPSSPPLSPPGHSRGKTRGAQNKTETSKCRSMIKTKHCGRTMDGGPCMRLLRRRSKKKEGKKGEEIVPRHAKDIHTRQRFFRYLRRNRTDTKAGILLSTRLRATTRELRDQMERENEPSQ